MGAIFAPAGYAAARLRGWAKREFDSIFTREMIEKAKMISPVRNDVTPHSFYEYSPMLADRVGFPWSSGVADVARKPKVAIERPSSNWFGVAPDVDRTFILIGAGILG